MSQYNWTTETGRVVMNNIYKPQDKDYYGKPLVKEATGAPFKKYFFALAIPKKPGEQHWNQTPWGAQIWKIAHDIFQGVADAPTFAWKIVDGDSQIPNEKGVRPASREGYPGHWVISCTTEWALIDKIYNSNGSAKIGTEGAIKNGDYIQANITCVAEFRTAKPGVFMNPIMLAIQGTGVEIHQGPDATAVGFGGGALPPGATALPVDPATQAGFGQQMSPLEAMAPPPPPNPAILQMPPPPPAHQMTSLAGGATYEQCIAVGWTDETLRANGMML